MSGKRFAPSVPVSKAPMQVNAIGVPQREPSAGLRAQVAYRSRQSWASASPGAVVAMSKRRSSVTGAEARSAILQLQRTFGNRYVQRLLDGAEKGTDPGRVARQPETEEEELQAQRQVEEEETELEAQRQTEEEELQADRQGTGEPAVAPEVEATIARKQGGGQALDSGVRAQMEPALGANFSGVRVHTDSEANALNRTLGARAFTTGQDIFFRHGEYSPGTSTGQELLAHELSHVVQQGGSDDRVGPSRLQRVCPECEEEMGARAVQAKLTVSAPDDPLEQEAEETAREVTRRVDRKPTTPKAKADEMNMKRHKGNTDAKTTGSMNWTSGSD